jgi:DNA modification methylase
MNTTQATDQGTNTRAPRFEHVRPQDLKPFPHNARTHSKRQIQQLSKSFQKYEFVGVVVIDEDGHILAGHARVAAAILAGLETIPAMRVDYLTANEKRGFVLNDNKSALNAGWDREILTAELEHLTMIEFDVELTGFSTAEIDLIIDDAAQAKANSPDDDAPSYDDNNIVTAPGDIWILGKHRLICGDARDDATYRTLLADEKAEFVLSDPPYNLKTSDIGGLGRFQHRNFAMGSGELTSAQHIALLQTVFKCACDHSTSGSIHQHFMDWKHIGEILTAGNAVYTQLMNLLVWNKNNGGIGSFYRSKHELIFVWKSGAAPHINNFELGQHGRYRTNVLDYAGVNTFGQERDNLALHPTVKPVALIADLIKDCSRQNGIVLDPFGGSGTLLISAERTGRRARVIEIDPRYCDVSIRRWQVLSGKNALHEETGLAFEEVELLRAPAAEMETSYDK